MLIFLATSHRLATSFELVFSGFEQIGGLVLEPLTSVMRGGAVFKCPYASICKLDTMLV